MLIYEIPPILGMGYKDVFLTNNSVPGLKCTVIEPMNSSVFTDRDFASSLLTHRTSKNVEHESDDDTENQPPASDINGRRNSRWSSPKQPGHCCVLLYINAK